MSAKGEGKVKNAAGTTRLTSMTRAATSSAGGRPQRSAWLSEIRPSLPFESFEGFERRGGPWQPTAFLFAAAQWRARKQEGQRRRREERATHLP